MTDRQLQRFCDLACVIGRFFDNCLKTAVILVGIYLTIEIASAFLPGGTVERVLRGGR